jgi:hypothetical protein
VDEGWRAEPERLLGRARWEQPWAVEEEVTVVVVVVAAAAAAAAVLWKTTMMVEGHTWAFWAAGRTG